MSKENDKLPWYEDIKGRFDELSLQVAYMRGELDEMKRHNGKIMKFLMGLVIALLVIVGALIGVKIPLL